jgi:hypothetical protein
MTLTELKNFINKLPNEMNDFQVVNGEVGIIETEDGESFNYRVDKPIIFLYVDVETKEICIFHQTQEDVKNMSQE